MERQGLGYLFLMGYTVLLVWGNMMPMFLGEKAGMLSFLFLIVYLLTWSFWLQRAEKKWGKAAVIFWGIVLVLLVLEIPWRLYGVYFPLFTPFLIGTLSLFWSGSFLLENDTVLLLCRGIVAVVYFLAAIKGCLQKQGVTERK